MPKAKKLPSGSWRVQVFAGKTADGKQIRKSFTAATRKEAELIAAQYAAGKKRVCSSLTVGGAITQYINSKSNILSPTTVREYRRMNDTRLHNIINIQLSRLTQNDVQNEINMLSRNHSAKTVANTYGLLSAALNTYAPDLNFKITLPAKRKIIREMPDPSEIMQIIKNTEIEIPCLLAIWLGMRMSEIRGLRKSDIKNGCITIQNTIVTVSGENVEKSSTKTYDSTRKCTLPDYILNLINNIETEHITELTGQAIYKRFVRLQIKNNIDPVIRFHDLRHLNASIMLQLGVPDKYAMERGGWSTNNVLKSVYQHTFSSEREIVDKTINDYFNSLI